MKKIYLLSCLLMLAVYSVHAEIKDTTYPSVGKPCPDFQLTDVRGYSSSTVRLKDLKGKHFLLDFFTNGCATCFASFDHLNKLKKAMGDSVTLILVGLDDARIRQQYEKFQKRFQLQLPVAYTADLFSRYGISAVPFVLWVDDKGTVDAISSSGDVTEENIRKFITGQSFAYRENSHASDSSVEASYDWKKLLLIDGNGGQDTDFIFRSVLTQWHPGIAQSIPSFVSNTPYGYANYGYMAKNRYQATGIWLPLLFTMAYGDTMWSTPSLDLPNSYSRYAVAPELHIKDPSLWKPDFLTGKGLYCYSLAVPEGTTTLEMQHMIQRELRNYFHYQVTVEEKMSPCWVITAMPNALDKLKTRGGAGSYLTDDATRIEWTKAPMKAWIIQLYLLHPQEGPFLDETGITSNIDIHLEGYPDESLEQLAAHMKPHGLILQRAMRKLKVIVVRDAEDLE